MPLESNDAWAPAEVGLFSEQARAVRRCGNNAGRRGRARTQRTHRERSFWETTRPSYHLELISVWLVALKSQASSLWVGWVV